MEEKKPLNNFDKFIIVLVILLIAGFIFYKERKSIPPLANVSQTFKEAEQATTVEPENTKTEIEQETQQNQQLQSQTMEADETEFYRTKMLEITDLVSAEYEAIETFPKEAISIIDSRITNYNKIISTNEIMVSRYPDDELLVQFFTLMSKAQKEDIKYFESVKKYFADSSTLIQNTINGLANLRTTIAFSNEEINSSQFQQFVAQLKDIHNGASKNFDLMKQQADTYRSKTQKNDREYLSLLDQFIATYQPAPQTPTPTININITQFSPPAENTFFDYFYQQQKIQQLQEINRNLDNIWYELAH